VGPFFAHAEARKAPTLDGKVQRTAHGKVIILIKDYKIQIKCFISGSTISCNFK
jgi:hypothetical protein